MTSHCHIQIKKIAQEMAGAMYEVWATEKKFGNDFYKKYPNQLAFIQAKWPHFVEPARDTLLEILRQPGNEVLKADIADVLIADAPLRLGRHRRGPIQVAKS